MASESQTKSASRTRTLGANTEDCFAIVIDIESYPEWVSGISAVEVVSKDDQERAKTARFTAQSFGRTTSYVLEYDYEMAPNKLSWSLVESDILDELSGSYSFTKTADGETQVDYEVSVKLSVQIPGFIQRRAEDKIISSALDGLSARLASNS